MRSPVLAALKSERRRLAKSLKLHDSMIVKLTKTAGKKTGRRKAARKSKDTGEVESIRIKDRPAKASKTAKPTDAEARAAKREALLGRKKKFPDGEAGE